MMCQKFLKLQDELRKKSSELNQLENEMETLWGMPFFYDTERVLQLDNEIIQKRMEISQVQNQLSTCKCYQAKCRLHGITYKNVG